MSMEKYGVENKSGLQKAELAKVSAEIEQRERARSDTSSFEKTAENIRAIEQLRARRTELLKAIADQ